MLKRLSVCAAVFAFATGTLSCPALVQNVGNTRVSAISVTGDSNTCIVSAMSPGDSFPCSISRVLSRDDFAATSWELVALNVTGTPSGTNQVLTNSGDGETLQNPTTPYQAQLSVTVESNRTSVPRAGEAVLYTVVVANTGNITVRNIVADQSTTAALDEQSTFSCGNVGSGPFNLSYATNITCTGVYTFDQPGFEQTEKRFRANFSASTPLVAAALSNEAVVTTDRSAVLKVTIPSCTLPEFAGKRCLLSQQPRCTVFVCQCLM
jgi:hypothetical protein